eukprot:6188801-Pleurochrysis_carterae.AAC.5
MDTTQLADVFKAVQDAANGEEEPPFPTACAALKHLVGLLRHVHAKDGDSAAEGTVVKSGVVNSTIWLCAKALPLSAQSVTLRQDMLILLRISVMALSTSSDANIGAAAEFVVRELCADSSCTSIITFGEAVSAARGMLSHERGAAAVARLHRRSDLFVQLERAARLSAEEVREWSLVERQAWAKRVRLDAAAALQQLNTNAKTTARSSVTDAGAVRFATTLGGEPAGL